MNHHEFQSPSTRSIHQFICTSIKMFMYTTVIGMQTKPIHCIGCCAVGIKTYYLFNKEMIIITEFIRNSL
jgi:hypothetical protein